MRLTKHIFSILLFSIISINLISAPDSTFNKTKTISKQTLAGCEPGQTSSELAINNVRFIVNSSGDMWWNLTNPVYEIPAGSGTHSLFAGSLWVGGLDTNNQLHIAAMKYRENGSDYWPGPLITSGDQQAEVNSGICQQYDQHFYISREMVREYIMYYQCSQDPDCDENVNFPAYVIPDVIQYWPAHGPSGGYDYYLAPFWDSNSDGEYNPYDGDFPYYEFPDFGFTDDPDCLRPRNRESKLFGSHTLWWVFNDKGNNHDETGGTSIGLEIHAQAFAFDDDSDIKNMSFYNYQIINRSTTTLHDTYIGIWADPDIGYQGDDYIGCDVSRGLGYAYNGDSYDESEGEDMGYGQNPPAIGIDFFEGPYMDADGMDNPSSWDTVNNIPVLNCESGDILNGNINGLNFEDGIIDNERSGMTSFMYFNNTSSGANINTLDPSMAIEYYNYLRGFWLDGTPLFYGGTGHYSNYLADQSTATKFAFPGNPTSDPCGWGQNGIPQDNWSEASLAMQSGDRRFVISSGPFTLYPGAINDITFGAVWARASSGNPWASVEAMQQADDIAQNMFNSCFRIMDGPDAPELNIIETNNKLIFHIFSIQASNNYLESYIGNDPSQIISNSSSQYMYNQKFKFQGYQVFQLKNANTDFETSRYDTSLVKEIFQCDIYDDINKIINYKFSDEQNDFIPVTEVNGSNNGIAHSFTISNDAFTEGSSNLVNFKEYYFTIIAYAQNDAELFNSQNPETFYYQKTPYLQSNYNIKVYKAMPHNTSPEDEGTTLNSEYDQKIAVEMTEGYGNSNYIIDLEQETIDEIMSGYPWKSNVRKYKEGYAPIEIKIVDPLNVKNDDYTLLFSHSETNALGLIGTSYASLSSPYYSPFNYSIYNSEGDTILSAFSVLLENETEELFTDWGFSVSLAQNNFSANNDKNSYQNGFLDAEIIFKDSNKRWLEFVEDLDNYNSYNWIRSGTYYHPEWDKSDCVNRNYDDFEGYDNDEYFENVLNGTWAPYKLTSTYIDGPAYLRARSLQNISRYEPISSVDLVITLDTTKWSRSCVIETCDNKWEQDTDCENELLQQVSPIVNENSIGGAHKFALRQSPSVDKSGNPLNDGTHGLGWFPGYAIDVRTGERLNIIFGEDSSMPDQNGTDMIWNPTSEYGTPENAVMGGKHFVYIMGNNQNYANEPYNAPNYDSCKWIYNNLLAYEETGVATTSLSRAWTSAMWCAIPVKNQYLENLACDVTVKLRVSTPYHKGIHEFEVNNPENDNYPVFKFSTRGLQAETSNAEVLTEALDIINIVPNPYYWGNHYGNYTYDNYVRIINLPKICEISIFNASGYLIRKITKNDSNTFYQWDMTDKNGNHITNGMYIIHLKVPGIGEKVLKWFGSTYTE
jgi:hypothetical protein